MEYRKQLTKNGAIPHKNKFVFALGEVKIIQYEIFLYNN